MTWGWMACNSSARRTRSWAFSLRRSSSGATTMCRILITCLICWRAIAWISGSPRKAAVSLATDLSSTATCSRRAPGTIVVPQSALLPAAVPAGLPARGVDFGLDAVACDRSGNFQTLLFSTEILFGGEPSFTDGDVLHMGDGIVKTNEELVGCFEPKSKFLGLDALSFADTTQADLRRGRSISRWRGCPRAASARTGWPMA